MRIQLCGRLSIEGLARTIDEVEFPGRLGRRLWAYLVLNRRRPVGRGEIVAALWGEESPDASDASVNALASRLRHTLARTGELAELRSATGAYTLALPSGTFVDRERAWSAIHHVAAIRSRGDVAGAWAESVIACEIAQRGFLPGESGDWIEAERRTLRDIELQALEVLAEVEIDQDRPAEAERVARVTGCSCARSRREAMRHKLHVSWMSAARRSPRRRRRHRKRRNESSARSWVRRTVR